MIQFHKNTDRQQDRRMDTTYFIHRIILATAWGPAITTAVDWHFKSQRYRVQCQSYQNYCITVSMQKISSIHKLIIKIQQIFRSLEHTIFDQTHPKIIEITFSFLEFAPACKKISSFYQFIFEIQSILGSHDQNGPTHF